VRVFEARVLMLSALDPAPNGNAELLWKSNVPTFELVGCRLIERHIARSAIASDTQQVMAWEALKLRRRQNERVGKARDPFAQ